MDDYATLKADLLAKGAKFEDADFPAEESSLAFTPQASWAGITWKRPHEIVDDPKFRLEGASRFDLSQGELGNCWFVSAAATLATRPALFKRVVHLDQSFNEGDCAGIFRFTFWRYGAWQEVVVDDRLPTKDDHLVFCSNRQHANEFWPALMEKAYAKLHGSYLALEAGYSHDALVDFTGGIGEFVDFDDDTVKTLFRLLRQSKRMRSLMCASIKVPEGGSYEDKLANGLVTGHAYSLTDVLRVTANGKKARLVRLRNPWGHKEWNGAWSDGSAEWEAVSEEEKAKLDLQTADDGEFWMSFEDFVENFRTVQICHLGPESVFEKKDCRQWCSSVYHGSWVRGLTAGGAGLPPDQDKYWMNPQYFVRLTEVDELESESCTLVVSLIQKYRRQLKTVKQSQEDFEEAIAFDILTFKNDSPQEVDGQHYDETVLRQERKMYRYEYLRERSARFELDPGTYCIIPCTYKADTEAEFMVRIATVKPAQSGELDSVSGPSVEPAAKAPVARKFDRMFAKHSGEDGEVDARELKRILNAGLKRETDEAFEKATARALVAWAAPGDGGLLDKASCKRVWREVKRLRGVFDKHDIDENGVLDQKEMRKAFRSIGFDMNKKTLVSIAHRYCGKNGNLTLDDFVLLATKAAAQFEVHAHLAEKARRTNKEMVSFDQWFQETL